MAYIYALLSSLLLAISIVADSFLANWKIKNVFILVWGFTIFDFIFVPFLLLYEPISVMSWQLYGVAFLIGTLELCFTIPYLKSLDKIDESIVTALFALSNVFLPLFSYITVRESLGWNAYLGFFIIIFSSAMLSLEKEARFKFNKAFWYMLFASICTTLQCSLYKYMLQETTFVNTMSYPLIVPVFVLSLMFFSKKHRESFNRNKKELLSNSHIFLFLELLYFISIIFSNLSLKGLSTVETKSIIAFTPFFTMGVIFLANKLYKDKFQEKLTKNHMLKKIILFIVMVLGIAIIWS